MSEFKVGDKVKVGDMLLDWTAAGYHTAIQAAKLDGVIEKITDLGEFNVWVKFEGYETAMDFAANELELVEHGVDPRDAELAALRAQNAALTAALAPFAALGKALQGKVGYNTQRKDGTPHDIYGFNDALVTSADFEYALQVWNEGQS